MTSQEEQERYRYLQLKMKMAKSTGTEQPPLTDRFNLKGADATFGIKQAAPSNIGKLAGVASVNAPGATGLLVNSLPGIGNPSGIMPAAQNLRNNPNQLMQAFKRMSAVQTGGAMTSQEKIPANVGQGAGAALEMIATPGLPINKMKASGPFTAGIKAPGTALPGTFSKAGEELGAAKSAAGAGIESPVIDDLMTRLEDPKEAKGLLTEARKWVASGMKGDTPAAILLAYKQVLGEAQAEGGSFSDVYASASRKISQKLAEGWPDLAAKLESMHLNFLAKGGNVKGFPWLTSAVNPKIGLTKLLTTPPFKNAMGAGIGLMTRQIPQISSAVNSLLNRGESK